MKYILYLNSLVFGKPLLKKYFTRSIRMNFIEKDLPKQAFFMVVMFITD